jgi:hypothetical protein
MRTGINSNAGYASMMLCTGGMSEPSLGNGEGAYLGTTSRYHTPFFLDTRNLLNPHITALGMSGAGKTYFLKSLIMRCVLCCNKKALVLDWNGEYGSCVAFLGGRVEGPESAQSSLEAFDQNNATSIDLSAMKNDSERKRTAARILDDLVCEMHQMPVDKDNKRIVVLDEAWRFMESAGDIGALFREGRKYGIGIVTATQLTSDVDKEVLSNAACTAVFRLQNSSDYKFLTGAEIVNEQESQQIAQLRQGACLLSMVMKDTSDRTSFFIERVEGIDTRVYGIRCDRMYLRIPGAEFQRVTERHFDGPDIRQRVEAYASINGRELEAASFVKFLLGLGLRRCEIVPYLRALGIGDTVIAEAYERA